VHKQFYRRKFFYWLTFFPLAFLSISYSQQLIASEQTSGTLDEVNIELTTHLGDQQVYIDKDNISFFISIDRPAYLYAFYKDASGSIYQLMPGMAQKNHFFSTGFYIPFPAKNSAFKFQVQAPFGNETIYIYASDQQQIIFDSLTNNQSLLQITETIKTIESTVKQASRTLYGHTSLSIKTQEKN